MLEGISGGHQVQPLKESRSYYRIICHLTCLYSSAYLENIHQKIRELSGTNLKLPVLYYIETSIMNFLLRLYIDFIWKGAK